MPPNQATNQVAAYPYSSQISEAAWQHATAEGLLWKYVQDYKIYRCPDGDKESFVTYSMSHSMNTWRSPPNGSAGPGSISRTISIKSQIKKPAARYVFLDTGYAKQGAFYVSYDMSNNNPMKWYDPPPMRHNKGTTFSFADGHAIYIKWTDPHTLASVNCSWGGCPGDNCDCDLRWITKATWGDVPYDCTDPAKNCEN
jgi:prepilin-type processing-associated H-X9-DG protein